MSSPVYRALLVGNSTYPEDPHNLPDLKGPPNDLRLFEDALVHEQVGLHERSNVQSLLDCKQAEVMANLETFFLDAKRDDQLLFYYSGHGRLDKFNNLYLCARDTRTNRLTSSAIPDSQINNMIQNSVSQRVILILDCCHSGAFKGGEGIPRSLLGEGRFVLTSSRRRELSNDAADEDDASPFTRLLVDALISGEVDTNRDNYVSINEVYDYILPRLEDATKQTPQRHYDEAIGELALGKSINTKPRRDTPIAVRKPRHSAARKPILAVSTELITIDDVAPDEKLPEEIIDVYNQGGGELDWSVSCDDEWIEATKHKGYFTLHLSPRPGVNRGRIYVRDQISGATKRIPVVVKVNEAVQSPKLELSQDSVDFGELHQGAPLPVATVRMHNAGGGELNASASTSAEWLTVKCHSDILDITANTSRAGDLRGEVRVTSSGGNQTIPVTAHVETGAVISVDPKRVKFGTVSETDALRRKIKITNEGSGQLEWDYEVRADFVEVARTKKGLEIVLDAPPGPHRGSIFVNSNGGDVTIDVSARVEAAPPMPEQPVVPSEGSIAGRWAVSGAGFIQVVGVEPQFQYTEFNPMGVAVGQGSLFVQGSQVTLQGQNLLGGPLNGQFTLAGNTMQGHLSNMMQTTPMMFVRMDG